MNSYGKSTCCRHIEKKWLPAECMSQNRRFTAYALKCLVIILVAALRQHFRAFLSPALRFRHFLYWIYICRFSNTSFSNVFIMQHFLFLLFYYNMFLYIYLVKLEKRHCKRSVAIHLMGRNLYDKHRQTSRWDYGFL